MKNNENKKSEKEGGKKFDAGKPELDLLPFESLEEIAKVLTMGKNKYGRSNWKNGISYSRLIAASLRHTGQFLNGIDLDDESKISHVAHAATNLLFLLWMIKHRPDLDDRKE